jgi:hypothetical protein
LSNPNVTEKTHVDGVDDSAAALHGDYGHLVIETRWVYLNRERWEELKTEGDRILTHAEAVEAQRVADDVDEDGGLTATEMLDVVLHGAAIVTAAFAADDEPCEYHGGTDEAAWARRYPLAARLEATQAAELEGSDQ